MGQEQNNKVYLSSEIALAMDDEDKTVPTQIMVGDSRQLYVHGVDLTIAKEKMRQIVKNFNLGTLGRKIPVNYDHPRNSFGGMPSIAAGWVKELKAKEGVDKEVTLFAKIEWNDRGEEDIVNKRYAYVSPGLYWNFINPQDGETEHGAVLYEISLTNDPANTRLDSIVELNNNTNNSTALEDNMPDDIKKFKEELSAAKVELASMTTELAKTKTELEQTISELSAERKKRAEHQRSVELDGFIKEGRITPAAKETAMKLCASGYVGFKAGIPEKAVVAMSAKSVSSPTGAKGQYASPGDEVDALASKMVKEDASMSYSDAVSSVLETNKELAVRYYNEE